MTSAVDKAARAMISSLHHRGPDDNGLHFCNELYPSSLRVCPYNTCSQTMMCALSDTPGCRSSMWRMAINRLWERKVMRNVMIVDLMHAT